MTNGIESGRTAIAAESIERLAGTTGDTRLSDLDRNELLRAGVPANPVTAQTTNLVFYDSEASPSNSGLRGPLRDVETDPRGPSFPRPTEPTPTDSVPPTPRPVFPPPFYPTPGTEAPIGRPGVPRDGQDGLPVGRPGVPRDTERVPNNKPKPGAAENTTSRVIPPIPTPPYMSPR